MCNVYFRQEGKTLPISKVSLEVPLMLFEAIIKYLFFFFARAWEVRELPNDRAEPCGSKLISVIRVINNKMTSVIF